MTSSMMYRFQLAALVAALMSSAVLSLQAQGPDSASRQPYWFDKVVYGGGPSVGAPPSDFDGTKPPTQWCLAPAGRAPGDFGMAGWPWLEASRGWLRDVLSDTTDHGDGWRKVLGGAPRLAESDSIVHVMDDTTCKALAALVNREVLGWKVGPPPVVVLRVRDYLVVYPSNARRGHFGIAVGMTSQHQIRGVAAW